MQLILSCVNRDGLVVNKDNLLLLINTETEEMEWLELNISDSYNFIGTKGITYSGDYFLASILTNSKKDKLLVIDVVTKRHNISNYIKSKDVHSICSVFRGRFYVCSTGTNAMNQVVISPSTTNVIRDSKHYEFDKDLHFNCFVNWKNRWFASFYGEQWNEKYFENGAIIELSSNNRKIYSNINQPNSLFFNRNDELCFLESGKGLFHFGRNIISIGKGYPRGIIEDRNECGYWIACTDHSESLLKFFNYKGMMIKDMWIPSGYEIYNIVEAEGYLSKLL